MSGERFRELDAVKDPLYGYNRDQVHEVKKELKKVKQAHNSTKDKLKGKSGDIADLKDKLSSTDG